MKPNRNGNHLPFVPLNTPRRTTGATSTQLPLILAELTAFLLCCLLSRLCCLLSRLCCHPTSEVLILLRPLRGCHMRRAALPFIGVKFGHAVIHVVADFVRFIAILASTGSVEHFESAKSFALARMMVFMVVVVMPVAAGLKMF